MIATNVLKKQKRFYFSYIWRGVALMGIGIFAGTKILQDGMGTKVQTGGGANVILRDIMGFLTQYGINAEQLLPFAMAALFFIIAAIGLFNVFRGAWQMLPKHTMLGKSILTQQKGNESFEDMLASINSDMELEPHIFGSVYIGRRWILDVEAMRIVDIRAVFWFNHTTEDNVLCCVDEALNIWAASLRYRDERDDALHFLQKLLPGTATGDKAAYMAYLAEKMGVQTEDDEQQIGAPTTLAQGTTFAFVGENGIPTSNFTIEAACKELAGLKQAQKIALQVLSPKDSKVREISFAKSGSDCKVGILYRHDDEDFTDIKTVSEKQAQDILTELVEQKQLPQFNKSAIK